MKMAVRFYDFGPFRIDTARRVLFRDQRPVPLTARVFELLMLLIRERDRAVSRTELLDALWPDVAVEDGNLSVNISVLRKALQIDDFDAGYIETLPRMGYRFSGSVIEHAREQCPFEPELAARSGDERSALTSTAAHAPPGVAGTAAFVGRSGEIEVLESVARRMLRGEKRAVLVTGEAGIGKTTLVNAFLEGFERSTALWLARGQCVEQYGGTEPYLPFLEAFGRLCHASQGEKVVDILRQVAPTWLAQIPTLLGRAEAVSLNARVEGTTQQRMVREMADAVELLARERPVVLCFEDLHWADYSTLDLVVYLAYRSDPVRCLLIGTYRPGEDGAAAEALGKIKSNLRLRGVCTELALEHLRLAAVSDYLGERFGPANTDPGLASVIHERTRGNPLFVVQMADALSEQGLVQAGDQTHGADARREQLRLILPESTLQRIEAEVDGLPPFARSVLEAASVAGVEFSVSAVAAAIGQDVVRVESLCLDWSRKRRLLVAGPEQEWPDGTRTATCTFIHALYQHVLYRRLGAAHKARLHQRIGECLERGFGSRSKEIAAQLQLHFERGLEPRRAAGYIYQAGKTALSRGAHREAIEQLERGLGLLRSAPEQPENGRLELDVLFALGAALIMARGYGSPEVEQVYTRARKLVDLMEDEPGRLRLLAGIVLFFFTRGRLLVAHELALEFAALAASYPETAELEACAMLGRCESILGRPREAMQHIERGVALCGSDAAAPLATFRRQRSRVVVLATAGWPLWVSGYPERGLEYVERALALAEGLQHASSMAYVLFVAGHAHALRGDPIHLARVEALRVLAEKEGFAYYRACARLLRGQALVELGHVEEGVRSLDEGWAAYAATGAELFGSQWLAAFSRGLLQVGRFDQAVVKLREASELARRNDEGYWASELWRLEGELRLEWKQRGLAESALGVLGQHSAEDCLTQALERAKADGSLAFELRAAMSLARLWKNDDGRRLVRDVYDRFTEGHATADLVAARRLTETPFAANESTRPRETRRRATSKARSSPG